MGWGGSKKCKPIPIPPYDAGLKSHPIPVPPPLRGGENPHGAKQGGTGQAGRGKIAIPNCIINLRFILSLNKCALYIFANLCNIVHICLVYNVNLTLIVQYKHIIFLN